MCWEKHTGPLVPYLERTKDTGRRKLNMTIPGDEVSVSINGDDVSIGPPDQVTVTNTELLNALVQFPDETLQFLSETSPVRLEEISVDPEGRVVITNSAFAQALRDRVSAALGGGVIVVANAKCGNVMKCAVA
jgi:hypothetical protein